MSLEKEREIDMGKIGILTFHRASNYGAVLQSYALQRTVHMLGADAEIIDYRCDEVEDSHNPAAVFHKNPFFHALRLLPNKIVKYRTFNSFRNRMLNMSKCYTKTTIKTANNAYSTYIAGSDQVWSPVFSGNDDVYQLAFADSFNKYSYACSFGFDEFPAELKKSYLHNLKSIRTVSVREASAKKLLGAENMEARVDVDPTMLLTTKEWDKLANYPGTKNPYILLYTVQPPVILLDYARKLSEKTGYELVYLNNEHKKNKDIKHVRYASPEEFVGWFAQAEYVLTNSFHGTVFSVLYHKKCKIELETGKKFNNRSRDLLMALKLKICILKKNDDYEFQEKWEEANMILDNMRESSVEYLKQIIANSVEEAEC